MLFAACVLVRVPPRRRTPPRNACRPREEDIEPELASEDDDDAPPGPAPPAATPRAAVSLHESAPADVAGQDAGASPEVPALPKSAPPAARPSGLMSQQRAFLQSNAPKAGAGLRPGGLSHLGVGGQSLCARMRGVESGIRKLEARLEQRAPRGSIPSPPPKTAGREAAAAPFVARVVATSWMTTHLAVHCVPVAVLEAQVQWVIGAQHSSADRDAGSEGSAQQKSQASQRGQPARAALDGSTSVVVLVPAATARKLEVLEGGRIAVQAPWCVVLGAGDPGVAVVLGHLFEVGR
ncbi:unnamed protein product [Pedinophyceae sp. YPF-701]|nr:unnamed protein product [Pedinophyceae sp. YPF-701]